MLECIRKSDNVGNSRLFNFFLEFISQSRYFRIMAFFFALKSWKVTFYRTQAYNYEG